MNLTDPDGMSPDGPPNDDPPPIDPNGNVLNLPAGSILGKVFSGDTYNLKGGEGTVIPMEGSLWTYQTPTEGGGWITHTARFNVKTGAFTGYNAGLEEMDEDADQIAYERVLAEEQAIYMAEFNRRHRESGNTFLMGTFMFVGVVASVGAVGLAFRMLGAGTLAKEAGAELADQVSVSLTGYSLPPISLKDLLKFKKIRNNIVGVFGDNKGKLAHKQFAKNFDDIYGEAYGKLADYHVVGFHGSNGKFGFSKSPFGQSIFGGKDKHFEIPDDVVFDFIKKHSGWDGKKPILLMSCFGGCSKKFRQRGALDAGSFYEDDFIPNAQRLANRLNINVLGAMHKINTKPNDIKVAPSYFLHKNHTSKPEWQFFFPQ